MNLSYKDLKFILESIDRLLNQYNTRLEKIEDLEEHEDEASDLANDCMFLESLKLEIEQNMNLDNTVDSIVSSSNESKNTLESLTESILQLSINERLLLVEAITQSIRKETNLIAS